MSVERQFAMCKPGDLGIIGDPVEHSLSPSMQNAAITVWSNVFSERKSSFPVYHRFLVHPDQLESFFTNAKRFELLGFNVTVPHKVAACKYVDKLDPFAKRIGALNTVLIKEGIVTGYNTDGDGFQEALHRDLNFSATNQTCLVIGAGGTGRVLVTTLLDHGASHVFVWNRDPAKVDQLMQTFPEGRISRVRTADEINHAVSQSILIVNATSVGLRLEDGLPLDTIQFSTQHVVYDVIYHLETKFMKMAKAAGARVSGGLGMLIYQGARSFEVWTQTPAPIDAMKQALITKLEHK